VQVTGATLHIETDDRAGVAPRRHVPWPLRFGTLVAAAVVVIPLAYLVLRATSDGFDVVAETLWRARTFELLGRSIALAAAVAVASLAIGSGLAWLVTRTDLPARNVWAVVFALPLAVPSYVAAWAWLGWRPELAGMPGAFLVLTSMSYPYVYLPVMAALRYSDPSLEEAARSLGRGPVGVFFSVTLRQVRVPAMAGALLVALYVLSDFGAVSIMRAETLTYAIFQSYRASFDRTPAAILGCLLVGVTGVVVMAEEWTRRHERYVRSGSGAPRPADLITLGRWTPVALLASVGWLVACLGVPAWSLSVWTAEGRSTADLDALASATLTTLGLGVAGAVATIVVTLPVGILSARYRGRMSRTVTVIAYAGHSLPGIVVALSLVFFGIRFATPIYQRTPMLILAYVVLFSSLAVGSIEGAIGRASPRYEDAARSLGLSQVGAWRVISLRLSAPGIAAGAALVFLTISKELPATLLLRPIGTNTLATRLWTHTDSSQLAAAAPYAVAVVLLAAVPTGLLVALGLRR
jgi:iron(III) transport system permease protein